MTHDNHDLDALRAEELALLRQIDAEPGYFQQLGAIFSGRSAWVNFVLMASQLLLFVPGVVCAIHFFQATTAHAAVFWGIPGAVLLMMSLMIKLAMWPVIQASRVLLAIKRLELLLVQQRS
ncbi:MAG: DUF6768 family protein [Novosphingobium sp.]|jgi:hypothetical protein|uniref:DUF6768 family protein n=1 Tax=Novosphingobium sp. TaxID=1874826 RepID=UPI003918CB1D|nr:hypothetical protein [Novosphingobium sp.]